MGIYQEIKAQIGARDVAEHYGYKVNRKGMMRCPFHDDRSPSMKVDQNFICFGCQEKGDVIDFAAKLFNCSHYDAAQKLIADFDLPIDQRERRKVQPGTRQRAKREQTEQRQFEQAVHRVYGVYCDYFRLLNRWAVEHAPRSPDQEFHPLFVEAMLRREYVEYLLDSLLYSSKEDRAEILIEKGKEVNELEKRIREYEAGDKKRASRDNGPLKSGDDGRGSYGDAGFGRQRPDPECDHQRRIDPVL